MAIISLIPPSHIPFKKKKKKKKKNGYTFYFKDSFCDILSPSEEGIFEWSSIQYFLTNKQEKEQENERENEEGTEGWGEEEGLGDYFCKQVERGGGCSSLASTVGIAGVGGESAQVKNQ